MIENLRRHQSEVVRAAKEMAIKGSGTIIAHVVPGGGKSVLPALVLKELPEGTKVGWFVPRDNLRTQGAEDALDDFGITIRDCVNVRKPSDGTGVRGFITTHQALTEMPNLWRDEFQRYPYLLVVDEFQHASIRQDGKPSRLVSALEKLNPRYCLLMGGHLERNDSEMIWHVEYEEENDHLIPRPEKSCDYFIRYTRADGITEKAIVKTDFVLFDGPASWIKGSEDGEHRINRLGDVGYDERSDALFTVLNTKFADEILEECLSQWRKHSGPLIILTARQKEASRRTDELRKRGESVYLAITNEGDGSEQIKRFRSDSNSKRVLITCAMAYEGLNVPTASDICLLTHIRSKPWIEQAIARVWRFSKGKRRAYVYAPMDRQMLDIKNAIQAEDVPDLRIWHEGEPGNSGASPQDILPLNGIVEEIIRQALDSGDYNDNQEAILNLLAERGIELPQSLLEQIMQALNAGPKKLAQETEGERIARMRKDLATFLNRKNYERGREPGYFQKELCRQFGSVEEMNLDQLKEVWRAASNL